MSFPGQHTNRVAICAIAAALCAGIAACEPQSPAVEEKLDQILAKLEALEEGQKELTAAAPARRGPPPEDYDKVHKIDLSNAPILGNPEAPITVVEYSDFQCPFCASTAPTIKALYDKYPEQVRIAYKHFPLSFHPAAKPAAVASLAAQDQGRFWEFHDVVFEATSKQQLSVEEFEAYAAEAGLDVDRFKRDLEAKRAEYERRIAEDYREGQRVDVRGTPTLYINGKKVRNRGLSAMSETVEGLLAAQGS